MAASSHSALALLLFSGRALAISLSPGLLERKVLEPRTPYYWPSGHGLPDREGYSPYAGPRNLSAAFAWSWHDPKGRFATLPYGTAIDGERNIYAFTDTAVWKLSPKGEAIWSFTPEPKTTVFNSGSILDGQVHFSTLDGRIWAVSMDSGKEVWSRKVCDKVNMANGFVTAHAGMVVVDGDVQPSPDHTRNANQNVYALNARNGETAWTFKPDMPLWNFRASITNNGTVLYQDYEGKAYCHDLKSGQLLWKAGGRPGSWTDGTPSLVNGVFYSVSAQMGALMIPTSLLYETPRGMRPGELQAHDAATGQLLWSATVPMPPNNAPAFGLLPGRSSPSLIQPGGYQGMQGGPTGIFAFDAKTGERQWTWKGPSQAHKHQAGEIDGMEQRLLAGATTGYVTNPWSAATIDVEGTVYVGHEDGLFFALRDENGDGKLEGREISSYDTGSAFVGSSSPAHAPGLLAVANCEGVFAFAA